MTITCTGGSIPPGTAGPAANKFSPIFNPVQAQFFEAQACVFSVLASGKSLQYDGLHSVSCFQISPLWSADGVFGTGSKRVCAADRGSCYARFLHFLEPYFLGIK